MKTLDTDWTVKRYRLYLDGLFAESWQWLEDGQADFIWVF